MSIIIIIVIIIMIIKLLSLQLSKESSVLLVMAKWVRHTYHGPLPGGLAFSS